MTKHAMTEAALRQFLGAVAAGAHPWRLDEACEQALRRELTASFEAEVGAGHWPPAEKKMMRVGRYVGSLGALLSESREPAGEPHDLDLDALLRAAGLVQALVCPFEGRSEAVGRPVAAGRFCRPGQFGLALDVSTIQKILTGR